jgi:predicted P-loop ATPase
MGRRKRKGDNNQIDVILAFVNKHYRVRYNDFTATVEVNGKPLQDRDINTIYARLHRLGCNVTHQDVARVLYSELIESYHPIVEFVEKHKDYQSKEFIKEVAGSVEVDSGILDNKGQSTEYFERFFRKWFVNLIAQVFEEGIPNPLFLALLGEQGTGKTEFLRRLLPQELLTFYSEHPLDKDKDFLIMMGSHLIIMDDELDGWNRTSMSFFKSLSSSTFITRRKPYARVPDRIKRQASLCGTGNECKY